MSSLWCYALLVCLYATRSNGVPLYSYFNPSGVIDEGLVAGDDGFTLNNRLIYIVGGSLHYFRVHPDYWRITLRKMKAAGLNTVTSYMPWNLHNPSKTEFDFGDKENDMSVFLNVEKFVELAKEEELFVILRPGPFIGSEWDFGGMPSWLLRDELLQVRSRDEQFKAYVTSYYTEMYIRLKDWFYINNGSIIAMQIENDFGYFGYSDFPRESEYLEWLKDGMDTLGFDSLLYFTSDTVSATGYWGSCPGVLQAVNIQDNVTDSIDDIELIQPNSPYMVMDISTGGFDYWISGKHEEMTASDEEVFKANLEELFRIEAAFNMYMFVGGTNFGFMAGSRLEEVFSSSEELVETLYKPITTSYDYDAPITESGEYTTKYDIIVTAMVEGYALWNDIDLPGKPTSRIKGDANTLNAVSQLDLNALLGQVKDRISLHNGPINMEALDINKDDSGNFSGQSFGYVHYETEVILQRQDNEIQILGHVRDMAQLFVDNREKTTILTDSDMEESFGFWDGRDEIIKFDHTLQIGNATSKVQFLVENMGRVSFGKPHFFDQRKGLYEGPILINQVEQMEWTAIPLEFKKEFVSGLTDWNENAATNDQTMPTAYLFEYPLEGTPKDIFIDTSQWNKGVIFVNGFNLGRYWTVEAPVTTMYLPAPLLKAQSVNQIIVFEQYSPSADLKLKLVTGPNYT